MSFTTTGATDSTAVPRVESLPRVDDILGVAIFDVSGLPREYFVTSDNTTTNWVQTVFQALGLKTLLMSSLKLEGFRNIAIHLDQRTAIVVRGRNAYIAVLVKGVKHFANDDAAEQFGHWTRQFEQTTLRQHPRFKSA